MEASVFLPSLVAHQREVPCLAQVTLAAGGQELAGVVVGDRRVLQIVIVTMLFTARS